MADMLARNWPILALRGVAAIVFGVLAWFWPDITLFTLVIFFGAYLLVDGVSNLVTAARGEIRESRWIVATMGIAEIVIAFLAFLWPGLTAIGLVFLIAAWAGTMGALAVFAAYYLRREIEDEWVLAITGLVLILFGICLAIFPGAGAIALVLLIGAGAVAYGVLSLTLAFRLRRWLREGATPTAANDARATASTGAEVRP
jgi:uncharacterized membrane protein HdeD (DUF308 family)